MAFDPSLDTDFPILTSEEEVDRLAAMYRQDREARAGSSTPPVAALSPTPVGNYESTGGSITPSAPTTTPADNNYESTGGSIAPLSTPTPTTAPDAGGDYGGGDVTTPTPTSTTAAPTPGDESWRGKSPLGGNWLGPPMDRNADTTPAEPSAWKEAAVGITRGVTGAAKGAGNILGLATRTLGKMTDSEVIKHFGDGIDNVVKALDDRAQGLLPPQSLSEAYDKGHLASWMIGKTAENVTGMLPILAAAKYAKLGTGIFMAYGAAEHAVKEAKEPGATPASVLAAAGDGAVAMGLPIPILHATATLPLLKRIAAQAMAFGGLAGAETFAAPIPKAVRGQGYDTPSVEQVLTGVLPSAAGGAVVAPFMGGKAAPGRVEPKAEEKPGEAPPAADTTAPPPPPSEPSPEPSPFTSPDLGPSVIQQRYGANPPAELPTAEATALSPIQQRYGVNPEPLAGPRGVVEQGPAISTGDPAVRAATEAAVNPPGVAETLGPSRIQQQFGATPAEPPPPVPVAEPSAARSRMQERLGTGRDTTIPDEAPPTPLPPPPPRGGGEAPSVTPRPDVTTDVTPRPVREYTTEPDHLDASRSVAKDANGQVVGKGATIEEALGDARARQGAPYEEQASAAEKAAVPAAPSLPETTPVAPPVAEAAPVASIKGEPSAATTARTKSKAKATPVKATTWGTVGREDAAKNEYRPPTNSDRARQLYQYGWEQAAGDAAWNVRRTGEAAPAEQPTETQPTTVVKRPVPKPTTVGEELQQRQLARKKGEQVAEGPPKVTKATQRTSLMERGVAEDIREVGERRGRAPTRGTPVEELGEDEAEGITPTEGGIAETRAASTTDKDLHYGDLLHDVLQGNKDIDEAAKAAGTKEPGTRGRPRRNKDLAEYIDKRIEQAETHNETDRQHLDRLSKTLVADNKLTPARRRAALKKINEDLEELGLDTHSDLPTARIEKFNAEMDARNKARGRSETERERLDELITMRDQLRGGPAKGKPRGGPAKGKPTKGKPTVLGAVSETVEKAIQARRGSYLISKITSPLVNAKVVARLERSTKSGVPDSLHDYLQDIGNDPFVHAFLPHTVTTAKRLLAILPDDIKVTTFEDLARDVNRPSIADIENPAGYFPDYDAIAFNPKTKNIVELLTHEGIHAATFKYLEHIHDKVGRGENLTPREQKHYDALNAIEEEVRTVLEATDEVPRSSSEENRLLYSLEGGGSYVAMRGRHEVLTQLLTDPHVISFLARTKASLDFQAEMQRLGYGKPRTVWEAVKGFLKDALGFKSDSVFDQVFHPLTDIVERGAKFRQETAPPKLTLADYGVFSPGEPRVRKGEVPTDALPSEWARNKMRPVGEAFLGANLFDEARAKVSGQGPAAARYGAKAGLFVSPTSIVARHNADVLPAGLKIRDAWARTEAAARDFYKERVDNVQRMVRQLNYGRDVGGLMHDATMAKAHLGNDITNFEARNAHLSEDEMKVANKLRDRFNKLTPENQQLYQDVRDHYRTLNAQTRALEYEHAARTALPEATDAQITALGEKLKTQAGIKEVLDNPDVMSQAFGERWENNRALVHEVAKLQSQGWVQGDYFPLRRYGEYVVRYGEPGAARYGVEMFERSDQAKTRQAELVQEFAKLKAKTGEDVHVTDVLSKAANPNPRSFFPDSVFAGLERALIKRGAGEEEINRAKEAWAQVMLQRAANSAQSQSRVRRNYVEGVGDDTAGKTLWNDFMSAGQRTGHLKHGVAETQAFSEARRQVGAIEGATGTPGSAADITRSAAQLAALKLRPDASPEDIAHAQQQHDWLVKPPSSRDAMRAREAYQHFEARRVPDGDNSRTMLGKGAGIFTKAGVVYHLVRPAKLFLDALGSHAVGQSILGARYGHAQAAVAIAKAMRDLAPNGMNTGFKNMVHAFTGEMQGSDWYMGDALAKRAAASRPGDKAYAAEMQALNTQANEYGVIDSTFARELQRQSGVGAFDFGNPTGRPGWTNVGSNMMNTFAAGEHAVDSTMRWVMLKAGYDMARRGGASEAEARRTAIDYTMEAIPVHSAWNNPSIASPRGPLGAMAPAMLQFKMYGMQMYAMMASKVMRAATPAERAEAVKALAGLVATHSILAGATATMFGLPVVGILGAWDLFQGKEKPHNYETDFRRMITSVAGETVGRFASSGLLGLAGVSQQPTLKLANMTNVPELRSFDKGGVGQWILQAMSGSSPEVAQQLFQGVHHLTTGEWGKAAKELLPRIIGDPIKAYDLATSGVTNARGQTIMPANKVTWGQVAAKTVGFNPTEPTLARERRYAEEELHGEVAYAHRQATDRFVASGGRDLSGVRAYQANSEYRQLMPLTYDQLYKQLKAERGRVAHPQLYGMIPPKKTEQRYIKETQFQ